MLPPGLANKTWQNVLGISKETKRREAPLHTPARARSVRHNVGCCFEKHSHGRLVEALHVCASTKVRKKENLGKLSSEIGIKNEYFA